MYLSSVAAALFAVLTVVYPLASQAATLQVDNSGQLLGADGVNVGGVLYDVDFVDGTCIALFDGCNGLDDFTFSTEATAEAATSALQSQVFIDGTAGAFDTTPSLTNGCEGASCSVYTPFSPTNAVQVEVAVFNNTSNSGGTPFTQDFINFLDTGDNPLVVFASWDISETTTIPLPATGWLFLSGLAGLFFAKRRKTLNAA